MEEKSFIEIATLATILLTIFTAGIIGYGVSGYYKVSQLMGQAEELTKEERYQEAAAKLEQAQKEWLVKSLKINDQQVGNLIYKNNKLEEDKSNYNQGLKEFENGNWEETVTMMSRIAGNSFYYQNAQSKIEEAKTKMPAPEPAAQNPAGTSTPSLPSTPIQTSNQTQTPGHPSAPTPPPAPGPPASSTPPAPPAGHTAAPVISNVKAANITTSSVTISWNTDEPASSKLEYATSENFDSAKSYSDNNFYTSLSVKMGSLIKGTTYYYRITAKDGSGNATTSAKYNFKTSAFGTLSVSFDSYNPQSATIISGTSNVEFLRLKLSASTDENIRIDKINLTVFPSSQCNSLFELIKVYDTEYDTLLSSGSRVWGGLINIIFDPPLVVPAGQDKILAIKANLAYSTAGCPTLYRLGLSYYQTDPPWSLSFANRYNISALGLKSEEKIYIDATATMYGNEMTVYGKPVFNYSSGSNPRTTPGRGEVLRINAVGGNRSFSVYRMTLALNLTDILNSGWNTCAPGKLEPSDFSFYPLGGAARGSWTLLNSGGSACADGEVVSFAQVDFSNPSQFLVGIGSDDDYIFEVDTSGATASGDGDTVKFDLPADASLTKYLTWGWSEEGVTSNGYGLKNFPVYGQSVNY